MDGKSANGYIESHAFKVIRGIFVSFVWCELTEIKTEAPANRLKQTIYQIKSNVIHYYCLNN